jgi:hypothetical protein
LTAYFHTSDATIHAVIERFSTLSSLKASSRSLCRIVVVKAGIIYITFVDLANIFFAAFAAM